MQVQDFDKMRDDIAMMTKEANRVLIEEHTARKPRTMKGDNLKLIDQNSEEMKLRKRKEEMERVAKEKEDEQASFMKTKQMYAFR